LKEFTRILPRKLSDKQMKRSVCSQTQSVLTTKKVNIKPDDKEFNLCYTVRNGIGNWLNMAVNPEPNGSGDGAGGVGSNPQGSPSLLAPAWIAPALLIVETMFFHHFHRQEKWTTENLLCYHNLYHLSHHELQIQPRITSLIVPSS
jgi:hypothetical protein